MNALGFPKEVSREVKAIHCPSDTDASGHGQRHGDQQEANAGGIERKQRQVPAGEQGEYGREQQDGKRVAPDEARKACEAGRHMAVAPQQQAEAEVSDSDSPQMAAV